ncbi:MULTISPECIES: PKD-like family lipoprotein [Butyricimonas]|uniref:PKD-like family lipoprotein n=1 Tax=Butyricimonas TaxID=574697 RepID=UPI0011DC77AD|nr:MULTISPECIES: PKD-like family lipoprotein [Butyricimonas]
MRNKILMICFLGYILLTGCMDDKTNLDYKDIVLPDSVIITNIEDQERFYLHENAIGARFKVTAGDELQLDLEVKYDGDDELAYEWRMDGKVISTEQNLRHVFTEEGNGQLFIYRKNAGNATIYGFLVEIRRPFSTGIVVLGKSNGVIQMDFVERYWEKKNVVLDGRLYSNFSVTEYIPHENVYPLYNDGEELGQNPVKVSRVSGLAPNPDDRYNALQILDRDWRKSVSVNSEDMKRIVSMKDEFVGEPVNLVPVNFESVGALSLVLDELGKIYTRVNYDAGNPNTGRFILEPLVFDDPYDVPDKGSEEINAKYVTAKGNLAIIYEKERKRFLALTASDGYYQSLDYYAVHDLSRPSNIANLPAGFIPLADFDKEIYAILFHESFLNENIYIIYKDGSDFYIQTFGINTILYTAEHSVSYTAVSNLKLPADAARLIEQGHGLVKIAMDKRYNDFMYVGAGNALYSMSMQGTAISKIHEFTEEGNMKDFVITTTWRGDGENAAQRYFNGRVFGAIFDNGDFRVLKLYDDPQKPGEIQKHYWVNKNFDGGAVALYYY